MVKDNLLNGLSGLAIAILTFFTPAMGLFALISVAALVDHFFGIWRVLKMREDFHFWGGVKKTFSKIVSYSVIIGIAFVFDQWLVNEVSRNLISTTEVIAKVLTLGLCLAEWTSINRNFEAVKGVSIWNSLLGGLQGARKIIEEGAKAKKMLLFSGIILLASCSPILRHNKLVEKYPYLHQMDSVDKAVQVPIDIPGVKTDTMFRDVLRTDTITIVKDRLQMKYFKDGDTVYLSGECDPIKEVRTVRIKAPVTYFPIPLKWYQFPIVIFGFCVASLGFGWFLSKRK